MGCETLPQVIGRSRASAIDQEGKIWCGRERVWKVWGEREKNATKRGRLQLRIPCSGRCYLPSDSFEGR